ncbi:MAG: hypothetical protein QXR03_01335 [Candidatus Aenigmatarchaeota archaeon]
MPELEKKSKISEKNILIKKLILIWFFINKKYIVNYKKAKLPKNNTINKTEVKIGKERSIIILNDIERIIAMIDPNKYFHLEFIK